MEKFVQARMGGNRPPETTGIGIDFNRYASISFALGVSR